MSIGRGSGAPEHVEWRTGLPFRGVDSGQHGRAAATLAEAFHDDPACGWLFPDKKSRVRCLTEFFTAAADWAAGHGGLVMASPGYECVYTVYPPGGDPAENDVVDLPVLRARADAIRTMARLAEQRRRALPPHLYGVYVGVTATARGRGLFKTVLSGIATWCDDRGMPFYFEATSVHAAARYEQAGFPRLGPPIVLPHGPDLYPIWRTPA